ncbi:MAG: EFR1 family ferrodoxin, partial [Clostridium sp.]
MKIFYFTSTGNSLYVSKKIKENFEECDLVKISRELDEVIVEDEKIGIVYPLHSFGLPIIVEEFIKK